MEEAASLTGRSPTTIKSWINQAGDEFVVERAQRGRAWRIDMPALLRWRERQIAARPRRQSAPVDAPALPPGLTAIGRIDNPVDAAAMLMGLLLTYRVPTMASALAVAAGSSCRTAFATGLALRVAMADAVREIGQELKMEPFASDPEAGMFDPAAFDEPEWQHLAEIAGEPIDEAAWHVWAQECFNDETPVSSGVNDHRR